MKDQRVVLHRLFVLLCSVNDLAAHINLFFAPKFITVLANTYLGTGT